MKNMQYYEHMNNLIKEVEKNLTSEIDYAKFARILGTSEYTMERIFVFLTKNTLKEYVRKRRLSRAGEDLRLTQESITDIAFKYQYSSLASFTNAFKKMHGVAPNKVRKDKKIALKSYPVLRIKQEIGDVEELEYRVIKMPSQEFYGKCTKVIDVEDKKAIANLWEECKADGTLDKIQETNGGVYYGASAYLGLHDMRSMHYYIMGKKNQKGFKQLTIPAANWALFKIKSIEQVDILKLIDLIYLNWLPSSPYKIIKPYPNIEIYYDGYCEYGIAVE